MRRPIALAVFFLSRSVAACSPPPQIDDGGFVRHGVDRLPSNARGVMFYAPGQVPMAADFQLVSAQDRRALALRVRSFPGVAWVRIEPVHGFLPGARYAFHYRPAHDKWRYPDSQTVTIDTAAVATAGAYALAPAAETVTRVVTVPTGRGSCWEPAVAVAHEFTWSIPAQLAPYRTALAYDIDYVEPGAPAAPVIDGWPYRPEVYYQNDRPLGQPHVPEYSVLDNAVVAPCGSASAPGTLRGTVSFPEVDERAYRTATVPLRWPQRDARACEPVAALVRTMRQRGPERALRGSCGMVLDTDFYLGGKRLAARPLDEWRRSLDFPNGLTPTCQLVALAWLWETRQFPADARTAAAIGAALGEGLDAARRMTDDPMYPTALAQAVHGLVHLVAHLPAERRDETAAALLAPVLPALVRALAEPAPYAPAEVADLIVRGAKLPRELRAALLVTARSTTPAAPHARRVLAALADPARR